MNGVWQLDIVKFALPLAKISFHPIFAVVGKHTNFFEAFQAASQPYFIFRFWLRRPCMELRLQGWSRYRLRFGSFLR